jgi:hypothetical protein
MGGGNTPLRLGIGQKNLIHLKINLQSPHKKIAHKDQQNPQTPTKSHTHIQKSPKTIPLPNDLIGIEDIQTIEDSLSNSPLYYLFQ